MYKFGIFFLITSHCWKHYLLPHYWCLVLELCCGNWSVGHFSFIWWVKDLFSCQTMYTIRASHTCPALLTDRYTQSSSHLRCPSVTAGGSASLTFTQMVRQSCLKNVKWADYCCSSCYEISKATMMIHLQFCKYTGAWNLIQSLPYTLRCGNNVWTSNSPKTDHVPCSMVFPNLMRQRVQKGMQAIVWRGAGNKNRK